MLYDEVVAVLNKKQSVQDYEELKQLYFKVTGKVYNSGCSGCAIRYLRTYLNNWITSKQKI